MERISLTLLDGTFCLHRLKPDAPIPESVLKGAFFAAMRTREELSLVVPEDLEVMSEGTEPGWACFKVDGVLDFSLVGILAELATALAQADVPIFALSAFTTDYILVKRSMLKPAAEALSSAGYHINSTD